MKMSGKMSNKITRMTNMLIMAAILIVAILHAQIFALEEGPLRPLFSWQNVKIGGGGFVSSIIADPLERNLFYARTDVGGAYRWDEAGKVWIPITDWMDASERGLLGVEAIATDPQVAGTVYMVAGTSYWNDGRSAFLRSTDRGNTWDVWYTWDPDGVKGAPVSSFGVHGNGMGRGNGEALAVDPNNSNIMFYGSKSNGLWRTTNGGQSWSHVSAWTTAAGSDTTWNGSGFSFVTFSPGSSDILYAGFLRDNNNVFRSLDGGATWSLIPNRPRPATSGGYIPPLMPQRIAIANDGSVLYITFGDGAGPHTMQWDEGWGMIDDWFNRGAVLRYNVATNTWADVSPENYIQDGAGSDDPSTYIAVYGGLAINPADPRELTVATIGYRQGQWWRVGNSWEGQWGTGIFHTTDGGDSWVQIIPDYWPPMNNNPSINHFDENGIGWMFNSSLHWTGSLAVDPFDPRRVFATSGNGVFMTENIRNYREDPDNCTWTANVCVPNIVSSVVWKVSSHGIEETVPYEVISIPNGPLVSVILDYDGFRHNDVAQYPSNRHMVNVGGENVSLGNTRALAFASKSGRLVKATDAVVHEGEYNNVPISPIQFSADSGRTWTVQAYENHGFGSTWGGALSLAISNDGQVVLVTPMGGDWNEVSPGNWQQEERPVRRYSGSAWSAVSGVDGAWIVGDPENANVFYAYNRNSGNLFKSTDKGATFSLTSSPGASAFYKMRLAPNREGDIWIPLGDNGLTRSVDGGATWSTLSTVSYCEAVGFGKAAEDRDYPTLFIFGTVNGVTGVFMSIDEGENWWRANDNNHEFGGLANGEFVTGDMNVFGRVYMSTAGRGIVYGDITDWTTATSIRRPTAARPNMNNIVRIRNSAITIRGEAGAVHQVRVFDMRGRQIYRRNVTGVETLSMNRLLPRGTYVVQVRRDNVDVYKGRMRVLR